jgi:hypothetical protein
MKKNILVENNLEKVFDKKFGSSHMKISKDGLYSKSEFWNEKTVENNIL